ncbi:DUF4352 domain-containing protein [Shouchella xiaoxiensis]|uniref:DUF4352 domain-containing protein n=1 Tax=Shouchella xiaoxiensis TaxID=766895 RepID=UPI001EF99486|nr:DUF4352 domain-containing protein [Shouchella xiaoxiensis]
MYKPFASLISSLSNCASSGKTAPINFEESIGDETPERDYFIVADITLKNLEDETIDIEDALDKFELTGFLEGSGGGEYSHYYDAIEQMQGDLESGEEIDGQLLFEENESEEYHIRVTEGLLSANGVKNQAIWTFTMDDAN